MALIASSKYVMKSVADSDAARGGERKAEAIPSGDSDGRLEALQQQLDAKDWLLNQLQASQHLIKAFPVCRSSNGV